MSFISVLVLSDKGVASKERFFSVMDNQLRNLRNEFDEIELRALPGVVGVPAYAESRGLAFNEVDLEDNLDDDGVSIDYRRLSYESDLLLVFLADSNSPYLETINWAKRDEPEPDKIVHVIPFSKIAKKGGAQ